MVRAGLGAGADQTEAVVALGEQRNMFTEEDVGQSGAPHAELAADAVGRLRLGIEGLELAGGSPKEDEDTGIGRGPSLGRVRLLQAKQPR
jgi:hypothetical protein